MIVKLAVLFLCVMALAGLILGRRRPRRIEKPKKPKAVRCPSCGGWIVEGSRCTCDRADT